MFCRLNDTCLAAWPVVTVRCSVVRSHQMCQVGSHWRIIAVAVSEITLVFVGCFDWQSGMQAQG